MSNISGSCEIPENANKLRLVHERMQLDKCWSNQDVLYDLKRRSWESEVEVIPSTVSFIM